MNSKRIDSPAQTRAPPPRPNLTTPLVIGHLSKSPQRLPCPKWWHGLVGGSPYHSITRPFKTIINTFLRLAWDTLRRRQKFFWQQGPTCRFIRIVCVRPPRCTRVNLPKHPFRKWLTRLWKTAPKRLATRPGRESAKCRKPEGIMSGDARPDTNRPERRPCLAKHSSRLTGDRPIGGST